MDKDRKLEKITEVKEMLKKIKNDLREGKLKRRDIKLEKLIEASMKAIEKETLYEATSIIEILLDIFDEEVRSLGKKLLKPKTYLIMTLPLPQIIELPKIKEISETDYGQDKKTVSDTNQEERPPPTIRHSKYSVEEERENLLRKLSESGTIQLFQWLSESENVEQYIVRIVVLGLLLKDGKITITRDREISLNAVEN